MITSMLTLTERLTFIYANSLIGGGDHHRGGPVDIDDVNVDADRGRLTFIYADSLIGGGDHHRGGPVDIDDVNVDTDRVTHLHICRFSDRR